MCGIWALFGSDVEQEHIRECLKIAHRGPDAFRLENNSYLKGCYLGFHRLTILDDYYGMQPMRIHSMPHAWLIYNGEIYNYKQLGEEFDINFETGCDGEVILQLYRKFGIEFTAKHLDGVFFFCLVDKAANKVHLGRDTYGVRPGFKLHTEDGFLGVCSEAKGLVNMIPGGDKYKIEVVSPGTVETYDLTENGNCTFSERAVFHKIGNPPAYKTRIQSLGDDVYANVRTLLRAAVKKRLMGQRRIGCLLSGGLDSSLVAALVCEYVREEGIAYPVQTFATGMEGSPDLEAARKMAEYLGTEHHEVLFSAEDALNVLPAVISTLETYDITTIRASVGMYLISSYIKKNSESIIILSGEGADEVAQGYIYYHKAPSPADADSDSRRLLNDLHYFDVLRADRTTAAHGLELRVPFLDHQLTAYILSLPAETRQPQDGVEKHLIRQAFSDSALIPNDVLWRPKEAFSDGVSSQKRSWFQILQEYADQKVSDSELEEAASVYPFNTPQTKEAYLYRAEFDQLYPASAHLIPYFWMPRWTTTNDPSARTLKHYKRS